MQVFGRETTDYIADRFYEYFRSIKPSKRISYKDASVLIDHETGPIPGSKNRYRPTDEAVDRVYAGAPERAEWTQVFDELLRRCQYDPETERFIRLTFKDGMSDAEVCKEMKIERATYYRWRRTSLEKAGVLAVQEGILEF